MTTANDVRLALEPRASLAMPIDAALEATTAALKAEGFGVLTTIDVRATFDAKLGVPFDPYLILGACNPSLAHQAISIDPDIGLMLPCNVVLHERDGVTTVSIVDPNAMLAAAVGRPEIEAVAREAASRLRRVAEVLAS